jgi:hypothetical protein
MNAVKINKDKITLELSKNELGVLGNALNEVCNGIEVWEFDTRMGIKIDDARNILEYLISIYTKASQASSNDIEE